MITSHVGRPRAPTGQHADRPATGDNADHDYAAGTGWGAGGPT
jgi:hypothetical protein